MAFHTWPSFGRYINMDESGRELNPHGTSDFSVACYLETIGQGKGCYVPEHWHDDLELLCVLTGSIAVRVDGEEVVLDEGDSVFFNRRSHHMIVGNPQGSIASAVFNPVVVAGMPDSVFAHKYVGPIISDGARSHVVFRASEDPQVATWVQQAVASARSEHDGFEFTVRDSLSHAVYAAWDKMDRPAAVHASETTAEAGRLNRMCMFVKDHLGERFAVADIAAAAKISERECLRSFKKNLGVSPSRYVTLQRLSRAASLLVCDNASVSSIADMVGFATAGYFSKAFKDEYGCTPSEYRSRMSGVGLKDRAVLEGHPLSVDPGHVAGRKGPADGGAHSAKARGGRIDAAGPEDGSVMLGTGAAPHPSFDELGGKRGTGGAGNDSIG